MLEGTPMDITVSCRDNGPGEVDAKTVKFESDLFGIFNKQKQYLSDEIHKKTKTPGRGQNSEENRSSTGQSGTSVLDQEQSPIDDSSLCSTSPICAAPLCRQFWKAGTYNDDGITPKSTFQSNSSYLHIHPKFLHSNATSHKWAFGAIAELLDNSVDEIQNGATFVFIDKTLNPRNGSSALLIQDDGGGMDLDAMRRCLSFGFSDKKSKSAIGQYGNGFKTSSMRLGADVIVFSRNVTNRKLTQSIGLLSYTFLTQAGHDRIVVPMVSYEFNMLTGTFNSLHPQDSKTSSSNMSVILQWSPYSTEEELLKQFDDVGPHGTKVIIYNLWFDDEGKMELDFESDPEDILIAGGGKSSMKDTSKLAISEKHLANRLRYSLRAYLSVLYLKLPETFAILLRGRVVEYHNIAMDLKYPEYIMYKPQNVTAEGSVITTIGFLKEAPDVNVHGFNVYHKNRLILPFWRVVSYSDSRGRGVVGILTANFVEPTHNKQDFEKTSVFQKLENRLKEMTWEYWDYHCGLIGYQIKKLPPQADSSGKSNFTHQHRLEDEHCVSRKGNTAGVNSKKPPAAGAQNPQPALYSRSGKVVQGEPHLKRKAPNNSKAVEVMQQQFEMESSFVDLDSNLGKQPDILANDQEAINVIQENQRLRAQCLEYEKVEQELAVEVNRLKRELRHAEHSYTNMLAELHYMEKVKDERNVQFT